MTTLTYTRYEMLRVLRNRQSVIFSLLFPITDAPHRLSTVPGETTLLADDDLATELAPDGRLGGLLSALTTAAPAGSPVRQAVCLEVDPDLVACDEQGKPDTVRYEAVNAMLLNEFLKEHRKVEVLEAKVAAQQKGFESQQEQYHSTAAQQQKEIEALTVTLREQATQIQKMGAQLQATNASPQRVAPNR